MLTPVEFRQGCAAVVPSTFVLLNDYGNTAEGGFVYNKKPNGDPGEVVALGRPIGECLVDGIKCTIFGASRIAKIIRTRSLPTPEQWLKAPNPAVFTAGVLYCTILEKPAPNRPQFATIRDPQYEAALAADRAAGEAAARANCTSGSRDFPETRRCISPTFLAYWESHGGLAQQGLPLTGEFMETSPIDGRDYLVQYFERARFEYHPENQAPYDVLLGLLGAEQYAAKYPNGTPARTDGRCDTGQQFFEQTRYCVPEIFLAYWQEHGALAQQGLPISGPFIETNPTNGRRYLTQYFERARFEYHPENQAPYDVLLGLLGAEQLAAE